MWEHINTLTAIATFLVIAAAAAAAIVQLRHLRSANQIAAIMSIVNHTQSKEFVEYIRFIRGELPGKLETFEFRDDIDSRRRLDASGHPEHRVASFFEQLGIFCKYGFIDAAPLLDLYAGYISMIWDQLMPTIAILRRTNVRQMENFEYLTILARRWLATHPAGAFPGYLQRLPVTDMWPEDRSRRC